MFSICSFLNSCVNPVALYCVSGVFRQHFNRYLCCICVKRQPHLRQHSTATGMMDNTSVMSMRRSTYVGGCGVPGGNLRASLHRNSQGGGGGLGSGGAGRGGSFHRQDSMPLQHGNGHGAAGGGAASGPSCGSAGRAVAVSEKR